MSTAVKLPDPDANGCIYGVWRPVLDGVRIRGVINTAEQWVGYELDVYGNVSVLDHGAVTAAFGALSMCSTKTIAMARRVLPGSLEAPVAGPNAQGAGS